MSCIVLAEATTAAGIIQAIIQDKTTPDKKEGKKEFKSSHERDLKGRLESKTRQDKT